MLKLEKFFRAKGTQGDYNGTSKPLKKEPKKDMGWLNTGPPSDFKLPSCRHRVVEGRRGKASQQKNSIRDGHLLASPPSEEQKNGGGHIGNLTC